MIIAWYVWGWSGGGGRCAIIVVICRLWLSGRLVAERAHLFNETLRCREKKRGGGGWQKDGKEAGTKRGPQKRYGNQGYVKEGEREGQERDRWRHREPHWCHRVWWNVELMRSWWSTSSPRTAPASISSSRLPLALPLPPGRALTANLAEELRHQRSRSEIPFLPRGF